MAKRRDIKVDVPEHTHSNLHPWVEPYITENPKHLKNHWRLLP